jgi:hypothetical protein
VSLALADDIINRSTVDGWDLAALLNDLMEAYHGLPLSVAQHLVERRGIDLSDIFGIATSSPMFAPARPSTPGVLRNDQVERGPSPATRGNYGNINHRRSQSV